MNSRPADIRTCAVRDVKIGRGNATTNAMLCCSVTLDFPIQGFPGGVHFPPPLLPFPVDAVLLDAPIDEPGNGKYADYYFHT